MSMSISSHCRPRCFSSPANIRRVGGTPNKYASEENSAAAQRLAVARHWRAGPLTPRASHSNRAQHFSVLYRDSHRITAVRAVSWKVSSPRTCSLSITIAQFSAQTKGVAPSSSPSEHYGAHPPGQHGVDGTPSSVRPIPTPLRVVTSSLASSSDAEVLDLAPAPSPTVAPSTSSVISRPESPLAHCRRAPPRASAPPMRVQSSKRMYSLSIALPRPGGVPFAPEMVTVTAGRSGRLDIVADAWHLEHDCHFEWHAAFPPRSVDLASVRARFDDEGGLTIDIPKRGCGLNNDASSQR